MAGRDRRTLRAAGAQFAAVSLDAPPLVVTSAHHPRPRNHASFVIGIGNGGNVDARSFDVLLTETPRARSPWVSVPSGELDRAIDELRTRAEANPVAAVAVAQVLRATEKLPFADALVVESLAYSTLLGGAEFQAWRRAHPPHARAEADAAVTFERDSDCVTLTLARQQRRNAMNAALRDELTEALRNVCDDPSVRSVSLRGAGPSFCAGGDLDEFGAARDLARAHLIRIEQSPALALHQCRASTTANVQGACIGAGIEIAAACNRVVARVDAFFQLPEVAMGLIPGAGGTVTLPRRIGRHRTCYLGLSGARLDAVAAVAWGLADSMEAVS